jgi:hypothetical protein
MDKIKVFTKRMKRLNIEVELSYNYPWIYLYEINGKRVKEKFKSEHFFTLAFLPIKNDEEIKFSDITEIFNLIRKYNGV